jgi:hypothetical protein
LSSTYSFDGPDSNARIPPLLLVLLLNAIAVSVAAASGFLVYVPLVLLGLTAAILLSRRLAAWLALVILGHLVLFFQRTTEISISEIIFGIVFVAYLALYLVDRIAVKRVPLLTAAGDNALVVFFAVAFLSVIPAMMFENDLGLWGRELIVLAGLGMYFPLRESMTTKEGKRVVLFSFALLAVAVAARNILQYRERLDVIQFAWELVSGRQTANEPLFMAMVVGAGAALGVSKSAWKQVFSAGVFLLFSLSLLVTFSRAYWVGTFVGLLIVFLLLQRRERTRFVATLCVVLLGWIGISWLILGDRFGAVADIVVRRLLSAGYVMKDVSFLTRVEESRVVAEHAFRNPILGYGLGAEFGYYNALKDVTYVNAYIHNAYLWLWFKLGAAGLLSFLVAYAGKIRSGFRTITITNNADRPFVIAAVALLCTMLIISVTSPQFYARDSVLVIALCWAILARSGETALKDP